MAHFYAGIQGNRGRATRLGTRSSGIDGFVNGWDTGVSIRASYDHETGKDEIHLYATHGSNDSSSTYLGKIVDGVFIKSSQAP